MEFRRQFNKPDISLKTRSEWNFDVKLHIFSLRSRSGPMRDGFQSRFLIKNVFKNMNVIKLFCPEQRNETNEKKWKAQTKSTVAFITWCDAAQTETNIWDRVQFLSELLLWLQIEKLEENY